MAELDTKNYDNQERLIENFIHMELKQDLLRGIFCFGLEKPSIIQQKSVMHIINGHDVAVQSQAGTGKSTSFIIGILQKIIPENHHLQAIILEPTREISLSVCYLMRSIGKFMDINIASSSQNFPSINDSCIRESSVQVLIGTPAHVFTILNEAFISTDFLNFLIIDEVDCLLSLGFGDKIQEILNFFSITAQFGLFSSTFINSEELKLVNYFGRDPMSIVMESQTLSLEGVKQYSIYFDREIYKYPTFLDIHETLKNAKIIIFCNSYAKVKWLAEQLIERYGDELDTVSYVCSDMNSAQKDELIRNFLNGRNKIFITIEKFWKYDNMDQYLYINYELPTDFDSYLNKIGRKGEYARQKFVFHFINEEDPIEIQFWKDLQMFFGIQVEELPENFESLL